MITHLICLQLALVVPFTTNNAAIAAPGAVREDRPDAVDARSLQQRCGLGAAFHAGRRAQLLSQLDAGCVLVRGMPATRDYVRFNQDKTFWYLTGIESPDAALLLDKQSGTAILFLPRADKMAEIWEGELWDAKDGWISELTGFSDIRPNSELSTALKQLAAADKLVWISKEPHVELSGCHDRAVLSDRAQSEDPFDGRASREDALERNLREDFGVEVRDLSPILHEMRRVKTPEEIAAMRRASEIGAHAMTEAMRATRPGSGEWQLDALMSFVHRREGADGPAYQAIVGSGPNALALHYSQCSRVMNAGEMLLIDYAPQFEHYTSDITRSWPVDGKFSARMGELYDAVLEAQAAGIAAVKPGATMREVDRACRKVLETRGLNKLMPHGACHYIGLEVHDVADKQKPLEPGVAFTVEPGVYEPSSGIGIRIEDVVVVTETGCEVLSKDVPKDRKTITELVGSKP